MTVRLRYVGDLDAMDDAARDAVFRRGVDDLQGAMQAVLPLRDDVRTRGDHALRDLTKRFDGVELDEVRVDPARMTEAVTRLDPDLVAALERFRDDVAAFHRRQLPATDEHETAPGVVAGRRVVPLSRVGCYVPGGRGSYPSTVLMTVVPAKVAGVRQVVVATPPPVSDVTLAACHLAGADEVVQVGGAQAVFALAYGTRSIRRVHKVVGPGNLYVAAAKALVAPEVATDAPAGPSEVFIVADDTADADLVALDLIAQAEHDPFAACVLATPSRDLADAVVAALERRVAATPRREVVEEALASRGAVIVTADLDAALSAADEYAPEHLTLVTRDPRGDLKRVTHYGSAFLGPWSAVALGDYGSGPNHVLPTAGLATGRAGLSVDDFVRRPTHQTVTPEGLRRLAPSVTQLAKAEGLDAHAASVSERLQRLDRRDAP